MLIFLGYDESVTDRPTDGRTDKPGFRDAWTRLKMNIRISEYHIKFEKAQFTQLDSTLIGLGHPTWVGYGVIPTPMREFRSNPDATINTQLGLL